ncbi:hypothetical protein [Glaesserella parasuis]|uniref:Uncharacterized protein n=1 Tax=Glaesserella parasuis serovar 5 (strain SH0165) TaxID=557723 RepID=B8F5I6_GLAP5|nr:hypothetical protein [Glaesserella parasuis]ACL32588.1 hypothetical protein HAPS_0962 [Glaesserella parasuis SH0165]MDG6248278.1 hypothetical protein [Glaesserella parasuis]MDG6263569.1 hypothetical protein [Glaesserella parasuis]MDG6284378.1 hypothetical protein [Glaesserella parasuis]MDG6286596.1 hypothetical protein [Glaesserella parasuis]
MKRLQHFSYRHYASTMPFHSIILYQKLIHQADEASVQLLHNIRILQ